MDTYQGSIFEPVTLHKYLYANANPVINVDPSGYSTFGEMNAAMDINGILDNSSTLNAMAIYGRLIAELAVGTAALIATYSVLDTLTDARFLELLKQGATNLAMLYMAMKVADLTKVLQKAVDKLNELHQCYYVYTLVDDDGVVRYVGRTKNLEQRLKNHEKSVKNGSLSLGSYVSNLTYPQSRSLEQTLMVYYHTREWLDECGNNSINGVGKGNKKIYHDAFVEIIDYADNLIDNELLSLKESINNWW